MRYSAGAMSDETTKRTGGRSCARGCGIAAAIFIVLLVTLVAVGFLFLAPRSASVVSGAQPGGRITGRVLPVAAAREIGSISVGRATQMPQGGYSSEQLMTVPLAADGSFAFEAPPVDGCYEIRARGGPWLADSRLVTLLAEDGTPLASADVQLELEPGGQIELHVTRRTEGATGKGEVRYEARSKHGLFFGALAGSQNGSLSMSNGRAVIDSLPPSTGEITIMMDDGATTSVDFDLEAGRIVIGVEL